MKRAYGREMDTDMENDPPADTSRPLPPAGANSTHAAAMGATTPCLLCATSPCSQRWGHLVQLTLIITMLDFTVLG